VLSHIQQHQRDMQQYHMPNAKKDVEMKPSDPAPIAPTQQNMSKKRTLLEM
jgi:hypothetical protein